MAQLPKELDPRASPAARFGVELRNRRTAQGFSLTALGHLVHVSGDLLGKIEKAQRHPRLDLVHRLDRTLHSDGELVRLAGALEHGPQKPLPEAVSASMLGFVTAIQPIADPADYLGLRCRDHKPVGNVGQHDIVAVRAATRRAAASENTFGGTDAMRSSETDLGNAVLLLGGQTTNRSNNNFRRRDSGCRTPRPPRRAAKRTTTSAAAV
ncbi:helix-turn-helix domain-containing protein [Nocardia acidivorans]|uniref:helix-turn-helix domain-containing protein n=1 Tax=Nocardia acidivorans TaxID=404580 RepID=UPI00082B4348|nr:helix-turn-helix transcriptional regulator [Nocardia acidivorans]